MRLSQCKGGFGGCIIDLFNPRYGGWKNYGSRLKLLAKLSNLGVFFLRFVGMPGFFEYEFISAGEKDYEAHFPIRGGQTKINQVWLEEFRAILKDIKTANFLPYVALIGGCDYPASRTVLLDPRQESHWNALQIYMQTVVRELKAVFGMDFLIETGNEMYVLLGKQKAGAEIQVRMADYLYSLGVPYGQIRLSGIDGGHTVTAAEWLQVAAFGPENLAEVLNASERKKYFLRRGMSEDVTRVSGDRLGISLHEIGYPADVNPDGTAGRARIHNYANYVQARFGPMAYSNDGVNFVKGKGYLGNTPTELKAVYKAVYPDLVHGLSGGIGTFENLPQDERTWTTCASVPAGKYVESMNFGPSFEAQFKALADAYKELTGREPFNRANPIVELIDEPETPEPVTPEPEPEEEEKEMQYTNLYGKNKPSFPWLNIRLSAWLKQFWKQPALRRCVWDSFLFACMVGLLVTFLIWIL